MAAQNESLIGLVEVPKEQAQVMLETGYMYMEMGDFKAAEEVFLGCAALLPRSEVPQLGLGHLFVSQERWNDAESAYNKALELRPESAEVHAFLGEAYLLQGKGDQAVPFLEKAKQLDQNDPPAASELAQSLLEAHSQGVFSRS